MSLVAAHGFSRVLTLVLAMIMATLPFIDSLPPWLTLGIIILAGWRVLAEHRGLVIIPPVSYRLLLALAVAGLLLLTNELGFGLTAATPLFVGFLWIKLLELKARRDYLLVCFLCYFLVSVLLCDRSSLLVSIYAMATIAVITTALVGYHMDGRARQVIRLGLRLTLTGLPLAIIIFLLFPRIQVTLPNLGQATAGFTDELTPGDVARLALSEEPVMRVEFPNNDMPTAEDLYWRGLVLSKTDGTTWGVADNVTPYREEPDVRNPDAPLVIQNITLEPMNQRWLFSLESAEVPPEQTRLTLSRALIRRNKPTQTLRYQVSSRIGELATDTDNDSVRIPEDIDLRIRQLAQSWRDDSNNAEDIIAKGIGFFLENNFTYSLSPGVMEGDDAADFLFNKRSGFCSHYATSFCLLMRCAGLPARVVVGFHRGDLNPVGGFLIIRHDHAHAWSEVQIAGQWQRYDPTVGIPLAPGETRPAALRNSSNTTLGSSDRKITWLPEFLQKPYSSVVQYWQFAEAKWESTVMGYDTSAQSEWLSNLGITGYITPILALGVVLVIIGSIVTMWWWRHKHRVNSSNDPLVLWYLRFCEHLASAGVTRLPYEGPRDFTQRAAVALPQYAEHITRLGNEYIAFRYGTKPTSGAEFKRLHSDLRHLPKRPTTSASATSVAS